MLREDPADDHESCTIGFTTVSTDSQRPDPARAALEAFETATRLPRGPHGLGRDEVEASQRERLQVALKLLLAEKGYGALTIGAICAEAGVSRATFYEIYSGKDDCILDSYETYARRILDAILAGVRGATGWIEFIDTVIDSYLAAVALDPAAARAFIVEIEAMGDEIRERRRRAMRGFGDAFAIRYRDLAESDPAFAPLPDEVFHGLVMAARELVRYRLEEDREADVLALGPPAKTLIKAVIAGAPHLK